MQAHYRASIAPQDDLSELWKDVFLFHWKEESQHAILDELEWQARTASSTPAQRAAAVDDLISLVVAVDGILQAQAKADARYFVASVGDADSPKRIANRSTTHSSRRTAGSTSSPASWSRASRRSCSALVDERQMRASRTRSHR